MDENRTNSEDKKDIITSHPKPSIGVDVDYYQSVIDDPEVCGSRKRELIEVIGNIVVQFIDLGFGVHPIQLSQVRDKPDKAECEDESNQPEKEKESERSDV